MKNIFYLILSLLIASSSYANDEAQPVSDDNIIVHKIEKNIVDLPSCNNDKLVKDVKNFIIDYFEKNKTYNVFERRRKFFILNNLSSFNKENLDNYKTEKARPISDVLINLKINENVLEENMLLCRNNNENVTDFYMLVYYAGETYKVRLLNLRHNQPANEEISFVYNLPNGENR